MYGQSYAKRYGKRIFSDAFGPLDGMERQMPAIERPTPDRLIEILRQNDQAGDILCGHAADEIERLLAERRWIPASEEVPEEGKHVMAWNSGGWCLKPWACHVICDYRDGEWREVEERDLYPGVTHWMPLPEPPEVKQ